MPRRALMDRRDGMTFIEVTIALAIFAVLLNAVGIVIEQSFSALATTADVEDTSARVLKKVITELQDATLSSIDLSAPTNAPSIDYSKITGWSGSSPDVTAHTISFDSGRVLQDGMVMADGVTDLFFNLGGNTLTVTVLIQRTQTVGGQEQTVSQQLSSTLKL